MTWWMLASLGGCRGVSVGYAFRGGYSPWSIEYSEKLWIDDGDVDGGRDAT